MLQHSSGKRANASVASDLEHLPVRLLEPRAFEVAERFFGREADTPLSTVAPVAIELQVRRHALRAAMRAALYAWTSTGGHPAPACKTVRAVPRGYFCNR